jgi:hypothetical protein
MAPDWLVWCQSSGGCFGQVDGQQLVQDQILQRRWLDYRHAHQCGGCPIRGSDNRPPHPHPNTRSTHRRTPQGPNLAFNGSPLIQPFPPKCKDVVAFYIRVQNNGQVALGSGWEIYIRDIHVASNAMSEFRATFDSYSR